MQKRSALTLAIIVGVIASLTTMIIFSFVFRVGLFNMVTENGEALPVSEFSTVEKYIETI